MLRFGPAEGPQVVAALPLFEEANRTRAFVVTILRLLADRGIGGTLPDLPGQGESLVATSEMRLADLRHAFASAAAYLGRPHILAVRSGTLLTRDARAAGRWLLTPVEGADAVNELVRIGRLAGAEPFPIDSPGLPHAVAGNLLSRDLLRDLRDATPDRTTPCRRVRLSTDPREAEAKVDGASLWRRAEPDNDIVLAQTLASDIADWIATCAG